MPKAERRQPKAVNCKTLPLMRRLGKLQFPVFFLVVLLTFLQVRDQSYTYYMKGWGSSSGSRGTCSKKSGVKEEANTPESQNLWKQLWQPACHNENGPNNTALLKGRYNNNNNNNNNKTNQEVLVQANHTLVTGFFPTPTKRHSIEWYWDVMQRTFSAHDAMIIFTTPDLMTNLSSLRAGKPEKTHIITMELNETRMARQYPLEYWQRLHFGRAHAHYTTYWVWNEKFEMLRKAADLNPFSSMTFWWIDAGMVRWDEYTNTTLIQRIPPQLGPDQFLVLNVTRITAKGRNQMMGAGIMGGYAPGIRRFHHHYYHGTWKQIYDATTYNANTTTYSPLTNEQHLMHKTCVDHSSSSRDDNNNNSSNHLCLSIRPEQRIARRRSCAYYVQQKYGSGVCYAMFYLLSFFNQNFFEAMLADGLVQMEYGPFTAP